MLTKTKLALAAALIIGTASGALASKDGVDTGAYYRFQVAHGHPHRPVQPHHHIGAPARHNLRRLPYQRACPRFLRGGNAVFEV